MEASQGSAIRPGANPSVVQGNAPPGKKEKGSSSEPLIRRIESGPRPDPKVQEIANEIGMPPAHLSEVEVKPTIQVWEDVEQMYKDIEEGVHLSCTSQRPISAPKSVPKRGDEGGEDGPLRLVATSLKGKGETGKIGGRLARSLQNAPKTEHEAQATAADFAATLDAWATDDKKAVDALAALALLAVEANEAGLPHLKTAAITSIFRFLEAHPNFGRRPMGQKDQQEFTNLFLRLHAAVQSGNRNAATKRLAKLFTLVQGEAILINPLLDGLTQALNHIGALVKPSVESHHQQGSEAVDPQDHDGAAPVKIAIMEIEERDPPVTWPEFMLKKAFPKFLHEGSAQAFGRPLAAMVAHGIGWGVTALAHMWGDLGYFPAVGVLGLAGTAMTVVWNSRLNAVTHEDYNTGGPCDTGKLHQSLMYRCLKWGAFFAPLVVPGAIGIGVGFAANAYFGNAGRAGEFALLAARLITTGMGARAAREAVQDWLRFPCLSGVKLRHADGSELSPDEQTRVNICRDLLYAITSIITMCLGVHAAYTWARGIQEIFDVVGIDIGLLFATVINEGLDAVNPEAAKYICKWFWEHFNWFGDTRYEVVEDPFEPNVIDHTFCQMRDFWVKNAAMRTNISVCGTDIWTVLYESLRRLEGVPPVAVYVMAAFAGIMNALFTGRRTAFLSHLEKPYHDPAPDHGSGPAENHLTDVGIDGAPDDGEEPVIAPSSEDAPCGVSGQKKRRVRYGSVVSEAAWKVLHPNTPHSMGHNKEQEPVKK